MSRSPIDDIIESVTDPDAPQPAPDPLQIGAPDPSVAPPRQTIPTDLDVANSPRDAPLNLHTPEHSSFQGANAYLPYRLPNTTLIWRGSKEIFDSSSNLMGSLWRGAQQTSLEGHQSDSNIVTTLEPVLGFAFKTARQLEDLLGVSFSNPIASSQDIADFKELHPGRKVPSNPTVQLLKLRNQQYNEEADNESILSNAKPTGFFSSALVGASKFLFSVLTNPEQVLAVGVAEAPFYGVTMNAWVERTATKEALEGLKPLGDVSEEDFQKSLRFGIQSTKGIKKAARFAGAKLAQGAALEVGPITLNEMQSDTHQPIADLLDVAKAALFIGKLDLGLKIGGTSLAKLAKRGLKAVRARDFVNRPHDHMSDEDAADINTTAVSQAAKGSDPDVSIPMRRAINTQSERFQQMMREEGLTADDVNAVLDEGDIGFKKDLEEKTKEQDEIEKPFRAVKIEPRYASLLSDQISEIDDELNGADPRENTRQLKETKAALKEIKPSVQKLQTRIDKLLEQIRLGVKLKPKETRKQALKRSNKRLDQLRAQLEPISNQQKTLVNTFNKLNTNDDLFEQRATRLKKMKKLTDRLGPKRAKGIVRPSEILKDAADNWNNVNEARLNADNKVRTSELLRHFTNNSQRFTKSDLDDYVRQQGPDQQPFSNERDRPRPIIERGPPIENAENLVGEHFTKEQEDDLIKSVFMDDVQKATLDDIQNAKATQKSLGNALKAASDCLVKRRE